MGTNKARHLSLSPRPFTSHRLEVPSSPELRWISANGCADQRCGQQLSKPATYEGCYRTRVV